MDVQGGSPDDGRIVSRRRYGGAPSAAGLAARCSSGAPAPPADGISHFEVRQFADGYGKALPQHWSHHPCICWPSPVFDRELLMTAAGDTLLLVTLCVVVMLVFRSLGRLCWPDDAAPRLAWLTYGCGLAVFFAFAILRVGLRMPDALVTSLAVATLWVWCQASARHLSVKWAAAAGVLSGVSYLGRANLPRGRSSSAASRASAPDVLPRRRFWRLARPAWDWCSSWAQSSCLPEVSRSARRASSGLPCMARYGRVLLGVVLEGGDPAVQNPQRAVSGVLTPVESSTTDDYLTRRAAWAIRAVNSCLMGAGLHRRRCGCCCGQYGQAFGVGRSRAPDPGDSRATLRWRLAWFLTRLPVRGHRHAPPPFCYGYYTSISHRADGGASLASRATRARATAMPRWRIDSRSPPRCSPDMSGRPKPLGARQIWPRPRPWPRP